MRLNRPLYIAAVISGTAAAIWHLAMLGKTASTPDPFEEKLHFASHGEYEHAMGILNKRAIVQLGDNDRKELHRWAKDTSKQQLVCLIFGELSGSLLMREFLPDLEVISSSTRSQDPFIESCLSAWCRTEEGKAIVVDLTKNGPVVLRNLAEQAVSAQVDAVRP